MKDLKELFSKGKELSEDLQKIIDCICLIRQESEALSQKFKKAAFLSDEECEDYYNNQENLLHQIENLLKLDTDYEDRELCGPDYKIIDSEVLREIRECLPFLNGYYTDFYILTNGMIIRFGAGGYPRLMFYNSLEEAGTTILEEIEFLKQFKDSYDDFIKY